MPFVLADAPQMFQALRGSVVDGFAFEIVVDLLVGHAEGFLIREGRAVFFQVRGGNLLPQARVGAEVLKHGGALAFV